jgi:hypothetical protein
VSRLRASTAESGRRTVARFGGTAVVAFAFYLLLGDPTDSFDVATGLVSAALVAVPSVLFGVFPDAFLGAFQGAPASFELYAASELTKALAATAAGIVGFWLLRGPLARLHPVDVDQVLHPLAAAGATAIAAGAVRAGRTATAASTELTGRLGSVVGEDPVTPESTLNAAMLALAATTAAALLLAAFA